MAVGSGSNDAGFNLGGAFRALGNRNFKLFFSGQLVSLTGTWMQMVAQSWLVYRLTGSAMLLGVTTFMQRAPIFFFSMAGGVVADRLPKRWLVVGTQSMAMLQAALMAYLTLTGRITFPQVLVLATALGFIYSLDMPARQAFIGEMVGQKDLTSAIALNSTAVNAARIAGPSLAGVLVAAVGEGLCFTINSISYLAVLTGLLMMRLNSPEPKQWSGLTSELTGGLRYVRSEKSAMFPLMLMAVVSFFCMPFVVLMPIMAEEVLNSGSRGLGLLMAASGVGAIVGAVILAGQTDRRRLPRLIVFSAALLAVTMAAFGISRNFVLSMGLMLVLGFCLMLISASVNSHLQAIVPDHLRGRLMSVYAMLFLGMVPFGGLLAGFLAYVSSAPVTLGIMGVTALTLILPIGRAMLRDISATSKLD